jgi:cytochrome c oxidase subunit 2
MMDIFDRLVAGVQSEVPSSERSGLTIPDRAADIAYEVDWTFNFILAVSVFFTVLITGLMVYFIIRYRHGKVKGPTKTPTHSLPLELTWTLIPTALVFVMFYTGFQGFMNMNLDSENAYEIAVQGQKWSWSFTYPNGYVDKDLHLPVDRNIRLVIGSSDVIHSVYIPAFRVKKDAVPGRYTKLWFTPTKPGEYNLYCAEYCGTSHSDMLAKVIVHEPGGFEKWLREASDFISKMPPAEAGERVFETRGCTQCHSVDGSAGIGPTLLAKFGKQEQLASGETIVADENYLRESILRPQAKIVAGYDAVMPTYEGRLDEDEVRVLIEYIKSLD